MTFFLIAPWRKLRFFFSVKAKDEINIGGGGEQTQMQWTTFLKPPFI